MVRVESVVVVSLALAPGLAGQRGDGSAPDATTAGLRFTKATAPHTRARANAHEWPSSHPHQTPWARGFARTALRPHGRWDRAPIVAFTSVRGECS